MLSWLFPALLWLQGSLVHEKQSRIVAIDQNEPTIALAPEWQVLGPFQIEATWGADPLEALGGFQVLPFDENRKFHSSLGRNGYVRWAKQSIGEVSQSRDFTEIKASVGFDDVDWDSLQAYYGWSAFQYQAWARIEFSISGISWQSIIVYTDYILEFWIDGDSFFGGDFYAYRRAPLVLPVSPGKHTMNIRLIRDVRAMGGVGLPDITFHVRIEKAVQALHLKEEFSIVPETVQGHGLASDLGSVSMGNTGKETLYIEKIESINKAFDVEILSSEVLSVLPGQFRPLAFRLVQKESIVTFLEFRILYRLGNSPIVNSQGLKVTIATRKIDEPHRYTFLHPSGIVSYAILRAPDHVPNSTVSESTALPILLNLHGAGLEADDDLVRHMLDPVAPISAWTISPTGVTPWSGDDWHVWGLADVEAAIAALPKWIDDMAWAGPRLENTKVYVAGHSNGGQGAWHILSHYPDRVVAAAPVSGYSSIQAYVPYQFWREVDPHIWMILQASLASYRHELLTDNFAGIPVFQQHGREDDNVPVFHSRRLSQLISESGYPSRYAELEGKGHWFDGVMTTKALQSFYESIKDFERDFSHFSKSFNTFYTNSGNMGSREGIFVDQLTSPDHFGAIKVEKDAPSSTWTLRTSNVFRFHLDSRYYSGGFPSNLVVDGIKLATCSEKGRWYVGGLSKDWEISQDQSWRSVNQRFGAQVGTLDAFLRTQGQILVSYSCPETLATASQVARNLYQYFSADCKIVQGFEVSMHHVGNVVSISEGLIAPKTQNTHPIRFQTSGILIRDHAGRDHLYHYGDGLGAIYLSPRQNEGLQLNIWGYDQVGHRQAARFLPLLTGIGQPDFMIVSKKCAWAGAAGILAAGFFDHDWKVSQASYLK